MKASLPQRIKRMMSKQWNQITLNPSRRCGEEKNPRLCRESKTDFLSGQAAMLQRCDRAPQEQKTCGQEYCYPLSFVGLMTLNVNIRLPRCYVSLLDGRQRFGETRCPLLQGHSSILLTERHFHNLILGFLITQRARNVYLSIQLNLVARWGFASILAVAQGSWCVSWEQEKLKRYFHVGT